ncbi:MAG: hypothetical protein WC390_09040 [Sulfurimonas sp.]|jgi:hypothetical protein
MANVKETDIDKLAKKPELTTTKMVSESDIPTQKPEDTYESKYDINANNIIEFNDRELEETIEKQLKEDIEKYRPSGAFINKLTKYEQMYLCEPDPAMNDDPWPNASNTRHPGASIACKGKHARWIKSMYGVTPYCLIEPIGEVTNQPEVKEMLSKLQGWFQYMYSKIMRAESEHKLVMLNAGKLNTGIAMIAWETKYDKVYENNVEYTDLQAFQTDFPTAKEAGISETKYQEYIQQLTPQSMSMQVSEMPIEGQEMGVSAPMPVVTIEKIAKCVKTYNYPILESINRDKFIIIPSDVSKLDTAVGYGYEFELSWNQLKKGESENRYFNIDRISKTGGQAVNINETEQQRKENEGKLGDDTDKDIKKMTFHPWKLIYHYDIDGDGLNEKLILTYLYEQNVLIRAELWDENLYFVPHYIERRPGRFDGIGVCAQLETINDQGDVFWNLRANTARMTCSPSFKGKRSSKFNPTEQEWYPGVIFWLEDMGDVEQWTIINNFPELYNEENQLEKLSQMKSGLTSGHSGRELGNDANAPGNKTMALINEGNILIDEDISTLREGVELVFYYIFRMCSKHLDKEDKYLKIFGLQKQDLQVALDQISLNGISVSQNPDVRRVNDTAFYETFRKEPILNSNPKTIQELLKTVFASWGRDKLALIPTDEDIKRMQIDAMKQALIEMEQQKMAMASEQSIQRIKQNAGQLPPPPPKPPKPNEIPKIEEPMKGEI